MGLLDALDNFAGLRSGLGRISERLDNWAGIPMPLEGKRLVIEPKFPDAEMLSAIGAPEETPNIGADGEDYTGAVVRNRFWSWKKRGTVVIWQRDGRIEWGVQHSIHGLGHAIETLSASVAWGIDQERRALDLLGTMLRHHTFKEYLLTGMFVEKSDRSGVFYLFRRLRPTVAIRRTAGGELRILCALCLHPIAYYEGSWAGAMCPTDDVIAHLALMRGDEPMFWRRANQHPPWRAEAGL